MLPEREREKKKFKTEINKSAVWKLFHNHVKGSH